MTAVQIKSPNPMFNNLNPRVTNPSHRVRVTNPRVMKYQHRKLIIIDDVTVSRHGKRHDFHFFSNSLLLKHI